LEHYFVDGTIPKSQKPVGLSQVSDTVWYACL